MHLYICNSKRQNVFLDYIHGNFFVFTVLPELTAGWGKNKNSTKEKGSWKKTTRNLILLEAALFAAEEAYQKGKDWFKDKGSKEAKEGMKDNKGDSGAQEVKQQPEVCLLTKNQ